MSTLFEITVVSDDEAAARAAIREALDEVERLGVVLSEWRPDSEVSRINAAAGREPVRVGPDTLANVRASLQIAEWTEGAYDITWAALREFYLFQPGEERVPDLEQVRSRLPLVNFRDVIVDEGASTVFLRRPGMAIGLGGIAKGYAVDRASDVLQRRGFRDFMIFGGGQVLVKGSRGDRPWRVGIQHPRRSDYIGFVEASNVSIATSGDYEHAFIAPDGTRWHHIIDLSTGLPARQSMSVTIIAPTGLLADGLDTGCFVMGPERCLAMLARLPDAGRVEAVIIDADYRLWTTPGTRDRLVLRVELDAENRIPH
jgi:thiamine biosynthesis lipoprotein